MYLPSWPERARFLIGLPLSLIYFPLMLLTVVFYALIPRGLFARLQDANRAKEVAARLAALRSHVAPGESVLDFGAGRGDFMKLVGDEFGADMIGIDIIDYRDEGINVLLFDGRTIPLPDKSVDVSMAAFVLHHTVDQDAVLRELIRVSRQRVVIFEDTYFSPWQYAFVVWNDYYSNILMGSLKAMKQLGKFAITSMPMPLTFRRVNAWEAFFRGHGLTVASTMVRHNAVKPMSKVTFVLDVPAA